MIFSQLELKATREIWDTYHKDVRTHEISFFKVINLFSDWFVKLENYKTKNINFIRNTFYDFVEDYYFDLRKQKRIEPMKYELNAQQSSELKPQNEQKELHFEQNAQQNLQLQNEQICTTCGSKFGTIQALNGHKRTCKLKQENAYN